MLRFSLYLTLAALLSGAFLALGHGSDTQTASVTNLTSRPSPTPILLSLSQNNEHVRRCSEDSKFYVPEDRLFCSNVPKLDRFRLFEVNLTKNRILFYEQGMLSQTFPIAYQAAYGKWFQTPTGYFEAGVKKPRFKSSIVPVYMEHAVQLYEDFFIHGIPYYEDGTRVTSQFSGGCIRLEDAVAEDFYATVRKGDTVVSYTTIEAYTTREGAVSPVDQDAFWVRQRFNSPLKVDWTWRKETAENYTQHTGIDLAPLSGVSNPAAYAIADGVVTRVVRNGIRDRGLGNTVLISHTIAGTTMYGLYAHLARVGESIQEGATVRAGDTVGIVGNTGYGCDYWHVGDDGCEELGEPDIHLHLELKTKPVLDAPVADPSCAISEDIHTCVGSTSDDPILFGYLDPLEVIFEQQ